MEACKIVHFNKIHLHMKMENTHLTEKFKVDFFVDKSKDIQVKKTRL